MEEVITVGATCKSTEPNTEYCQEPLEISSFSSRGEEVDVAAPGVYIWSTRPVAGALGFAGLVAGSQQMPGSPDPVAMANNRALYVTMNGTSMATPHVTGIVALMLDANPKLRPAQVERILTSTARDLGEPGFDTSYGFGFVDALAAVRAAERL